MLGPRLAKKTTGFRWRFGAESASGVRDFVYLRGRVFERQKGWRQQQQQQQQQQQLADRNSCDRPSQVMVVRNVE
ncbi:hypothetical protein E4U54_002250 [Claviceps lovelessii]|nr:hypothetical protein E4U54_002250 [Claviceps lovelessii]